MGSQIIVNVWHSQLLMSLISFNEMKAFEKQTKMHNFTNRNCEVLQENSEGKARMRKKKESQKLCQRSGSVGKMSDQQC